MLSFIIFLTAMVCMILMGAILIQNPKGGGIDTTFGGNASHKVLGAARSNVFIEKITWGLGTVLFVFCLLSSLLIG